MSWLRLDDGFASHPKLAALTDREFRIWVRLLCYLSRYNSEDGTVTRQSKQEVVGITPKFLAKCESLLLLDPVENELQVHDWNKYRHKPDNTVTERVQRHRDKVRNAVTEDVTNGVTSRARVPVPFPSQSESFKPPFVSSFVGEDERFKGTPLDQLLALASSEEDKQKIRRAAKGSPEAHLIDALEAASGPTVVSQLGAALARLKARKQEVAA